MKKQISALLFLFCSFLIFSQSPELRNSGSAKELKGSTYLLNCFVSDPYHEWTYGEKMDVYKKYFEATDWLVAQARRYGVTIDFDGGHFGLNEDIKLDYIGYGTGSGNENVQMVSNVLLKIGYTSPMQFYNWAMANTKCDNVIVLIFTKGSGVSYAMAYGNGMNSELYFTEGVMIYERYSNGLELLPATIAHELLHVFGAWDLYETFRQTRRAEELARIHFPNSIMLRIAYNINDLIVDQLTAWRIGWNTNPEPWYNNLNPDR